jgi:hypothetical protein
MVSGETTPKASPGGSKRTTLGEALSTVKSVSLIEKTFRVVP